MFIIVNSFEKNSLYIRVFFSTANSMYLSDAYLIHIRKHKNWENIEAMLSESLIFLIIHFACLHFSDTVLISCFFTEITYNDKTA